MVTAVACALPRPDKSGLPRRTEPVSIVPGSKAHEAPVIARALEEVDPALTRVASKEFGEHPLGWRDWRITPYAVLALADLRCEASMRCLERYLALTDVEARELAPSLSALATRAFLRQDPMPKQVEGLLRSSRPAVRGTAILDVLDRAGDGSSQGREAVLKAVHSWTVSLPRAAGPSQKP